MEPSVDDGLKWFGEGFDGFPKHLPTDTVEYCLFVIDEKLSSTAATEARLNEILKEAKAFTSELVKDYIWQRDSFSLRLRGHHDSPDTRQIKHKPNATLSLFGKATFGDSIADEWLIVYLLVEISKRFTDLWIKVSDTDGEFLLIEAANALPKWLNPDIAANRVWISNGHLRIIPLESAHASSRNLSVEEAIQFIRIRKDELVISPTIEDAALSRIQAYPAGIADSLHHALISLPRRVAYILHHNPAYVCAAAETFYLRDIVALKPLQTKDLATLAFPPEDFVRTSVKFTKVSYAQLRSQVFDAPPAWTGLLPRLHDEKVQIGMKLTCGFEMLLADAAHMDSKTVREIKLLLEDVDESDVQLPTDREISGWSTRQDDENWLDIDYADFEKELSGEASGDAPEAKGAQDNIRKMVTRFQEWMEDDTAGADGVSDDDDDVDDDETGSSVSSTGEDKEGSFDETEFEQAMKEMMGMSDAQRQHSGLLDEARKLAIADGEDDEEDIDEETQEMMKRMEQELKGHGALGRGGKPAASKKSVMFGPEPPPGLKRSIVQAQEESADEDVGPGDGELSSDDEDFNDVDLNLARNLLESFKGQAGTSGPAGNMLKALGMTLPRDEDE